jgi:hypothetical protein
VEHFVFCHPDSSLLNTAVFCIISEAFQHKAAACACHLSSQLQLREQSTVKVRVIFLARVAENPRENPQR